MKLSWLKLLQSCSKKLDMLLGEFLKISGTMRNWGRWSNIVTVRLPDIISVEIMLGKILSIIVFELSYHCWLDCVWKKHRLSKRI